MNRPDEQKTIAEYLARHNTVTLATCSGSSPWAAAVFYASDDDLALYFKSDPDTLHMQHIADNAEVAATIQADGQDWQTIRGLQIHGCCTAVGAADEPRVNRLYMEKYPFLIAVGESPGDATERMLAERLEQTPFYQLRPRWIRFIDNARGFGHKTEIRLREP